MQEIKPFEQLSKKEHRALRRQKKRGAESVSHENEARKAYREVEHEYCVGYFICWRFGLVCCQSSADTRR